MKKLPYEAPLVEIDEYCVEIGQDGSYITNNQEFTGFTDNYNESDQGGEWFDDGDLGGGGGGWLDF